MWRVSMAHCTEAEKIMIDKVNKHNASTKLVDKTLARCTIVEVYIWWSGKKREDNKQLKAVESWVLKK